MDDTDHYERAEARERSEDEKIELKSRLKRATELLREWRDKYGGRDTVVFKGGASEGDLAGATRRFLEGK